MAALGYVHLVRAFWRAPAACGADSVNQAVYSLIHRTKRRRETRIPKCPVLLLPQTVTAREMASSVPITDVMGWRRSRNKTSYEEAVTSLNSLQSNAETIRKSMAFRSESRKQNIPNMVNYLQRVGLSLEDVDKLSVIHVTGTKGKGSTCAFAESILRQYGYKTGIFSSPHLIEVRERIRINGRPLKRDLFTRYFWEVLDKLQTTKDDKEGSMPHYFSFLTVMALYVFVRERVDVAVLEVGIGGQYDSTNVVQSPVVCGVSSLDLDHTNLLGNTLQDIAWHKAGIFKRGAPAFTVPQPDCAMQVLFNRAQENECCLSIASPLTKEELSPSREMQLGIAGDKQWYNAALAVQMCRVWLSLRHAGYAENNMGSVAGDAIPTSIQDIPVQHSSGLSQQTIKGLCECRWPGRTQTVLTPGITYYLDGAHTADSIQQCVDWFEDSADKERNRLKGKVWRALVFNMTGDRSVSSLLAKLKDCGFHMAAFCPNVVSTIASENVPDQLNLRVQQETALEKAGFNRKTWDTLIASQATAAVDTSLQASSSCDGDIMTEQSAPHSYTTVNGSREHPQQCQSAVFPCIASALQWLTRRREVESRMLAVPAAAAAADVTGLPHMQVLVTGSLHLVGGVLEIITPDMND